MNKNSLISIERKQFHKSLLENVLMIDAKGIPSNADKDQKSSIQFAKHIAEQLMASAGERKAGQSSGNHFEQIVAGFLSSTFPKLSELRPGKWSVYQVGSRSRNKIAEFAQYEHLSLLNDLSKRNPSLAASLGNDYAIAPDIVITRAREEDTDINSKQIIVDESCAKLADLRSINGANELLHASISTKWTLRSDRAQNARAEALNLIRNRKGRSPHIAVVTGEPTPSRLSSLALGTGDIDCVYHFALPELVNAVKESGNDEAYQILDIMVSGKRLKDISDLPLDLAV